MKTMRALIGFTLVVLLSFAIVNGAIAQSPPASATTKTEVPPLSPDDVRKLREAAQMLTDALSGKKTASEAPTKVEKKEEPQKNVADVADRALSILSGYISSAEQAFKKVAPEVWRIMIRQQYANAIAGPLVPLALIGFFVIFVVVVKRWWPEPKLPERSDKDARDEYNADWWGRFWITNLIPFALCFSFGIWASISIAESIQKFINPEYYAFKDLLQIVLNKGGL